jgi:hypothetical protein
MKNKKRNLRQILFYFSLFGTYSVSFRLCNALSVYLLSFLAVFCFGKYFLRGSFSYIQSGEDADTACVFDGFLVTSFSCKGCGARKMKQKEHGFVVMEYLYQIRLIHTVHVTVHFFLFEFWEEF